MESDPQSSTEAEHDKSRATMSQDEKEMHERFMREALAMAEQALCNDETPVGCVLVRDNVIIARGMNHTNRTLNGTRHAEFVAINSILAPSITTSSQSLTITNSTTPPTSQNSFQESMDRWNQTDLYVTVEPCIMCASLLRQIGIRRVYFGAINDRFGGTGGVLSIHDLAYPGSSDPGYEVSGGWLREEAIMLLRRFYVQANEKAPEPRNKKERMLKTEIEPLTII